MSTAVKKVCIVGASGKLGQYMVQHSLDRGYEVVGVCREQQRARNWPRSRAASPSSPEPRTTREVIRRAVAGCDGVLTVLAPWGVQQYASGTAQAVLDHAGPGARLVFSCGWHITRDGKDVYSLAFTTGVRSPPGWASSPAPSRSTIRWRRAAGSSPAAPGGPWFAEAAWRRARARACPCGAGTWATRSWRAT